MPVSIQLVKHLQPNCATPNRLSNSATLMCVCLINRQVWMNGLINLWINQSIELDRFWTKSQTIVLLIAWKLANKSCKSTKCQALDTFITLPPSFVCNFPRVLHIQNNGSGNKRLRSIVEWEFVTKQPSWYFQQVKKTTKKDTKYVCMWKWIKNLVAQCANAC